MLIVLFVMLGGNSLLLGMRSAGANQLCLGSNGEFGPCATAPSPAATTSPITSPAEPTAHPAVHVSSNGIDLVAILTAIGWIVVAVGLVGLVVSLFRDEGAPLGNIRDHAANVFRFVPPDNGATDRPAPRSRPGAGSRVTTEARPEQHKKAST